MEAAMRKILPLILVIAVIFAGNAYGETDINGSLKVDLRSLVKQPYANFYNREDVLTLKISSAISDNVSFYGSIQGRYYDDPELQQFSDLQDRSKVDPLTMDIWEAYISISSFIFENMDAVIGKQIVSWGTADMLNPTNTLNPHDFSDPLDFSEKIPVTMLNFTYYPPWDQFNAVQMVWIPAHKPALLPPFNVFQMSVPRPSDLDAVLNGGLSDSTNPLFSKMSINKEENIYVDHNPFYPKYSEFGMRLSFNFFQTDFHLSYFNGYSEFPLPRKADIQITNTDEITNDVNAMLSGTEVDSIPVDVRSDIILAYPRYHIIGADFKADVWGAGVWAEAGYYIPYRYDITYTYPDFQWMQDNEMAYFLQNREFYVPYKTTKINLLDKPFLKYTIGADYVLPGGYHIEAQFARGFFFEQGGINLNDYLMLEMDKSFLDDTFKLTLSAGGSVEGGSLYHLINYAEFPDDMATGIFGGPKLEYFPYDGLTVTIGAVFMDGNNGSFFQNMRDMAQVYFQAESDF